MRAAQRVRIGNRRGPPAFAPVILLDAAIVSISAFSFGSGRRNFFQ